MGKVGGEGISLLDESCVLTLGGLGSGWWVDRHVGYVVICWISAPVPLS